MSHLNETERAVLKLVNDYAYLDLSGPRVSRSVKDTARNLLRTGHLTGTMKALSITIKGDYALGEQNFPS